LAKEYCQGLVGVGRESSREGRKKSRMHKMKSAKVLIISETPLKEFMILLLWAA